MADAQSSGNLGRMPSTITSQPLPLSTSAGEAADANFSPADYGNAGDQRPYQIVFPSYPAPKFLASFANLNDALRECGTLCRLTGQPFRLVKWGARVPCYPCQPKKKTNRLPSLRIHSAGALAGHPDATPIADFTPKGTVVYDAQGRPTVVGAPNYAVSRTPYPATEFVSFPPLPQRYAEAVRSAQYIASNTGKQTYLCSSNGADCKGSSKEWVPVVYVEPGGLVKRYREDLKLPNSPSGSTNSITPVTEDEFRELVRQSEGRTAMGQGA